MAHPRQPAHRATTSQRLDERHRGLRLVAGSGRNLLSDPRVPRRAKVVVAFAGLYDLSPIDLIPEFIPIIGPLDDVVVIALALRYVARRVPRDVLFEAWPAEPRLLERLVPDRPNPST